MHFSWAWLANLHSKANSPFRSKPAEMSAIRATRAEYKPAAFLIFSHQPQFLFTATVVHVASTITRNVTTSYPKRWVDVDLTDTVRSSSASASFTTRF